MAPLVRQDVDERMEVRIEFRPREGNEVRASDIIHVTWRGRGCCCCCCSIAVVSLEQAHGTETTNQSPRNDPEIPHIQDGIPSPSQNQGHDRVIKRD